MMTGNAESIARQRQDPLRRRYNTAANEALIRDHAHTVHDRAHDPFHGLVAPGEEREARWRFGIHRAVGGDHDLPNPGDILCAALAACLDSTLRMIADRLGIRIESLEVAASAEADVRGTLIVDRAVPVGFQRVQCRVQLHPGADVDPAKLQKLIAAAEHSCVVLQTLRSGVAVQTQLSIPNDRYTLASNTQPERSPP
jgi:uncharacterized OsmC-like protein